MVFNKMNQEVCCKGYDANKNIRIGNVYMANSKSLYYGLLGEVKEIKTGRDKDADNNTDDIIVDFMLPEDKNVLKELIKRFTVANHTEIAIDINLDGVVMSADMLEEI